MPIFAIVALLLLVLWAFMSVVFTSAGPAGGPSGLQLIQLLVGVAVALVAAAFSIRPWELALAAVPGGLAVSVSVIWEAEGAGGRVSALGLNPDYLAVLVVLMLAAVCVGGLSGRPALLANLLVWPVGLIALARTQSRGALVALVVMLCVLLLSGKRERLLDRRRILIGAASGLVVVIMVSGLAETLTSLLLSDRTAQDYARSNEQRTLALLASLQLMGEHPLFGIGYGHFPYAASETRGLYDFVNTHNEYTRFGAELGVLGLLLLVAPLGAALRYAADTRSRNVLAVLMAMAAAMLTGNFLNSVVTAYPFWVALGMGLSLCAASRDTPLRQATVRHGSEPAAPVAVGLARSKS